MVVVLFVCDVQVKSVRIFNALCNLIPNEHRTQMTPNTTAAERTWNILICLSYVNLRFSINNVELKSDVKLVKDSRDGLFDVKVVAKYPKVALKSETIINCQLTMPGTDYTKKQETVYYGKRNRFFFFSDARHFASCRHVGAASENLFSFGCRSALSALVAHKKSCRRICEKCVR